MLSDILKELYWIIEEMNWRPSTAGTKFLHNLVMPLEWRHNERNGVSNHQPYNCLLDRFSRHRSKKTSKLRVTGLCAGNSPVTGEYPAQGANNAGMFPFDDVIMWNVRCQNLTPSAARKLTDPWMKKFDIRLYRTVPLFPGDSTLVTVNKSCHGANIVSSLVAIEVVTTVVNMIWQDPKHTMVFVIAFVETCACIKQQMNDYGWLRVESATWSVSKVVVLDLYLYKLSIMTAKYECPRE